MVKNENKENNGSLPKQSSKQNNASLSLLDLYHAQMNIIQEKTGIPGSYVVIFLLTCVLFVYLNFLERFITNLVGTLYPAFWTMKSIEMRGDDNKQWLTYWVVFAFFSIIDMFSGFILKFIPFYFFLKIVFLIWLFMPNSGGAHLVYHLLVVRVFKSFEKDIDNASGKFTEYTKEMISIGKDYIDSGVTMTSKIVVSNITQNITTNLSKNIPSSEEIYNNPFKPSKLDKISSEKVTATRSTSSNSSLSQKVDPKRELKKNKKNN